MTPIFIITCDRLVCTRAAVASYHSCIRTPFEIVIVDFGSTYRPTVDYLKRLERAHIKVYWEKPISQVNHLNRASGCISDYFETHPQSNYVVTDSDVALDNTQGNILETYAHFLEKFPAIDVVGPMLRIDDIPERYPYKRQIYSGKMGMHKQFHSRAVSQYTYAGIDIQYIFAPIDTTFGMYRSGAQWARLSRGIRLLAPYAARHLDWYIDPKKLTPDQAYYMNHASKSIAHWAMVDGTKND